MGDVFIPYGRQSITEDDISEVVTVLRSSWITQGPRICEFEKALANYVGAKYAVAVSSGTSALHIAYLAAGVIDQDEVITTPITFLATANAALYCGGKPIFADIDQHTFNIDPCEIVKKISRKTKVIVPVHFAGNPCDILQINNIAQDNGLIVIEDACHALGAEYKLKDSWVKIGSCSHSEMTVFSFHPVKHITTGEGGAILTNNSTCYERLLTLRNHGITKTADKFLNKDLAYSSGKKLSPSASSISSESNPWYYEMQELGFNYRITDIQSALGMSQLKRIDAFTKKRREIASEYDNAFSVIEGVTVQQNNPQAKSSYHLYVLLIDFDKIGKTRAQVMNELKAKGVGTQVHYIPIHFQPYYKKMFGYKHGDYPLAEDFYFRAISLPIFPKMTDEEVRHVISSVKKCLEI